MSPMISALAASVTLATAQQDAGAIDPADIADMQCVTILLESRGSVTPERVHVVMGQVYYFLGRLDGRDSPFWDLALAHYRSGLSVAQRAALVQDHAQRCDLQSLRTLPVLREMIREPNDATATD